MQKITSPAKKMAHSCKENIKKGIYLVFFLSLFPSINATTVSIFTQGIMAIEMENKDRNSYATIFHSIHVQSGETI